VKKIRLGVLACSSVAQRRFLPALALADHAVLERIGSRDVAKAHAFAEEFHCTKWGTYEDILADPAVDAVYISTPPSLHERWILAAAEAGKHVYCEKPAFPGLESARRAVALFRSKGLRLMEGYMFRHHPQSRWALELIAGGAIGEPRVFRADYFYPRPAAGNIRLDPGLSGGVLSDSAGYAVAAALDAFGEEPQSVYSVVSRDEVSGVDCAVAMQLFFAGGRVAQQVAGFGLQYRSSYTVTGTTGRLEVQRAYAVAPDRATRLVLETDDGARTIEVPAADQFRLAIEAFAAAVLEGAAAKALFEDDLLRVQRVMEAVRRSVDSGQVATLEAVTA
jgi:dTDP-3,4-didehydro-2,6-dideoxy-alpha-D-glucose 3-reductase